MAKTIAITGKGGTGKTTIAALILRSLIGLAPGRVLAVDADPDANLATLLRVPVERTIGAMREDTLAAMKDFPAGMSKEAFLESELHQVVTEMPKFDLITMGRSEGPGCYCYINNLLRKFADALNSAYEWVVMDNEAGLEHISRRTAGQVDFLFVIVNENPLSLDSARRIEALIAELDNPVKRKCMIFNTVSDERIDLVRERSSGLSFDFLGAVPYDAELEWAVFRGDSILDIDASPAVAKVNEIVARIGA